MEIAYVVKPRPDTGLWNAKIAIWLFLASEVMLFGGLFSGYVFLRINAQPGMWPHDLMDVRMGTINTMLLIASSITAVFAWAAVKMRKFGEYRLWLGITILLGLTFLCIKIGFEYNKKFHHFGVFIKQDATSKYEPNLGNIYLAKKDLPPRYEISGDLEKITIDRNDADATVLDPLVKSLISKSKDKPESDKEYEPTTLGLQTVPITDPSDYYALLKVPGSVTNTEEKDPTKWVRKSDGVLPVAYTIEMDAVNADPTNPANDRPHLTGRKPVEGKKITVNANDVDYASYMTPDHSTFLGIYYLVTILHALHIVGGLIVFTYFFLPKGASLYKTDPEHFANRIETSCIYWHFVDLVWMFAFPIFYLL
ncbi:MAG TPA: cytochrome c oxidase subunit 3 [Chthoniobacteraceae bacterium]|nr:cytochrome c oxidase subunit 3 [Chthoniobacteraceae bacterium]